MIEQGKTLIYVASAFTVLGMLTLVFGVIVYPNNPLIAIGCGAIIVGLAMVGIAFGMATSGSSIAHRGEEQIPIFYNTPVEAPQAIVPDEIQVVQPVPQEPEQPT